MEAVQGLVALLDGAVVLLAGEAEHVVEVVEHLLAQQARLVELTNVFM